MEDAIRLFRRYFLNRVDVVAILAPWGKPCPAEANGNLDSLIAAHVLGMEAPDVAVSCRTRKGITALKGRFRIGIYCPGRENTTRSMCLDIDGAGHPAALADPQAIAIAVLIAFETAGLPCYLERSGGGNGWHVWVFFDPPIPAAMARALGQAFAPGDAALAAGGIADPESGHGIEVFPKQSRIKKTGFGNCVWFPWWSEAADGGNAFYRVTESGELEVDLPNEFKTVTREDVERVIASRHLPAPASEPRESDPSSNSAWADWRKKALAALPLDAVYGPWLTGKQSGDSWLECHDPDSPSGDQDPSAGVADGTGEAERGAFHSFISQKTTSVFDFLIARGEAKDLHGAQAIVAQLAGIPLPVRAMTTASTTIPSASHSRIIVNNRQLRDIVADAWAAVHAANDGPTLFRREATLVRLQPGESGPTIERLGEDEVFGHLARIADWFQATNDGIKNVHPPRNVAKDLRAYPDDRLPILDAVVRAPVFDRTGRLISTPGYHREAHLYLHLSPGFQIAPIPESPTDADVNAARALLLDDLLVDFPFVEDGDRAHAVAALVLPFIRDLISGPTPLHLLEAPSPGSGKGLLAEAITIIATGHASEPTTLPKDDDEIRKKITSLLLEAPEIILLDNQRRVLDSAALAAALTGEFWKDRLLGSSKNVRPRNRASWLLTANNPSLSLEMARRSIRCRVDAKTDRPWERTEFRHAALKDWAIEHRGELVHAILVLVQAWIAAGRPPGIRSLGSFESWASVIGGILEHAKIPGFLGNLDDLYANADSESQSWRAFTAAWWERYGPGSVAAADLLRLALADHQLDEVIGDKSERSQAIRLGKALTSKRDCQFGDFRIVLDKNEHTHTARYRLVSVERKEVIPDPPKRPATLFDFDVPSNPYEGD